MRGLIRSGRVMWEYSTGHAPKVPIVTRKQGSLCHKLCHRLCHKVSLHYLALFGNFHLKWGWALFSIIVMTHWEVGSACADKMKHLDCKYCKSNLTLFCWITLFLFIWPIDDHWGGFMGCYGVRSPFNGKNGGSRECGWVGLWDWGWGGSCLVCIEEIQS